MTDNPGATEMDTMTREHRSAMVHSPVTKALAERKMAELKKQADYSARLKMMGMKK